MENVAGVSSIEKPAWRANWVRCVRRSLVLLSRSFEKMRVSASVLFSACCGDGGVVGAGDGC